MRSYDLHPSPFIESLRNRLVLDWDGAAIRWASRGPHAARLPVIEISDPTAVPFPGYGGVRITFDELRQVVNDLHYSDRRAALSAVQGIYAILDARAGQLHVGKADGSERILGRWTAYAQDGHGGNVALRELGVKDPQHKQDFVFSILRVFDPGAPSVEVTPQSRTSSWRSPPVSLASTATEPSSPLTARTSRVEASIGRADRRRYDAGLPTDRIRQHAANRGV